MDSGYAAGPSNMTLQPDLAEHLSRDFRQRDLSKGTNTCLSGRDRGQAP
jgi:hypothetical protein